MRRLDRMPLQEIGRKLEAMLKQSNTLFVRLDTEVGPAARSTLASAQQMFHSANEILGQDSPLQSGVHLALTELRGALASLSVLSDYLERHPEVLIWGKGRDQ